MIFAMHKMRVLPFNRSMLVGVQAKVEREIDQHADPLHIDTRFVTDSCFASGNTMGVLNIWDAKQPTLVTQFKVHNGTINRLQFHPESKLCNGQTSSFGIH
jgi:WD40 repeat protein